MFPAFSFNCLLRYNISSTEQNRCSDALGYHWSSEQTCTTKRRRNIRRLKLIMIRFFSDGGGGRTYLYVRRRWATGIAIITQPSPSTSTSVTHNHLECRRRSWSGWWVERVLHFNRSSKKCQEFKDVTSKAIVHTLVWSRTSSQTRMARSSEGEKFRQEKGQLIITTLPAKGSPPTSRYSQKKSAIYSQQSKL